MIKLNSHLDANSLAYFLSETLTKLKKPNKRMLKPLDKDTLLKF
jgi:hypothetical protein